MRSQLLFGPCCWSDIGSGVMSYSENMLDTYNEKAMQGNFF